MSKSDIVAVTKSLQGLATQLQEQLLKLFHPPEQKVIVLAGPTGVGKSSLALRLAEKMGGEIVSADSIQVYRGMDIGTAKLPFNQRKGVPHHLIDIRDVCEPYNVVNFYQEAKHCCYDILRRGKVPIVAGGTGFYLHALIYGSPKGPPSNPKIRAILEAEADKFGIEPLFEKLQEYDPAYAATITPKDIHKVIRALEIIEISAKPVSSFCWKTQEPEPFFDFRPWFLHMPRKILYEALDTRCDEMLQAGLLKEVVHLDRLGIRTNPTARQAIGYKQSLEYLATGQTMKDYDEFVTIFKTASRHLV
ncbi:MAG TPA: tRNA (adenosine(37)-N6)-dimethylallyltransferase MiaA, partial [Chlamydiales bacterium]|nr:tRNA (adenosine(37)-N6)-dimethylallyltransferase MiaA [Chlamydiales bacterium]